MKKNMPSTVSYLLMQFQFLLENKSGVDDPAFLLKKLKSLKKEYNMTDQIILNSVGSYIQTDGYTGALLSNGLPDITSQVHILDVDKEWMDSLNDDDREAVNPILVEQKELNLPGQDGPETRKQFDWSDDADADWKNNREVH